MELSENPTKDILQTIYSLNTSGSKRVTIGLDTSLDFCPFLQLHKPGLDGVRLSWTTWQELMSVSDYISSFYKGELSRERMQDCLLLGPMEKIMFKFQYNRYMISIKSKTDDKKEVVLAHTTWIRLLDLAPCINDCLNKLNTWQCEAMEMFVAFAHAVKAKLPLDTVTQRPAHNGAPQDIISRALNVGHLPQIDKKIVWSVTFNDFIFTPKNIPLMDYQKCFYELQAFCSNEIICFVAYV